MLLNPAIKQLALDLGFDLAGIAPIHVSNDLEFSRQWAKRGCNGEMKYLENPRRFDPHLVLPSAKSVICVGLIYDTPFPYSTEVKPAPRAWISRYAWGRDYHDLMRASLDRLRVALESLAPGTETRMFVDTGPLVERAFARFSGIGWMGKNTCIINEKKGSWFFLGTILTSLELTPDAPAPDRCGSCTACLEACPTGALVEPHVMDASRCISYFTIELKGSIPEQFRPKIAGNVYGCDICQDVCPWNGGGHRPSSACGQHQITHPSITNIPQFYPVSVRPGRPAKEKGGQIKGPAIDRGQQTMDATGFSLFNPPLDHLAMISEDDFRRIFTHLAIKRPKYCGWLRNLSVAMGNSGSKGFLPWLEEAARHSDPAVREHAAWAIGRLQKKQEP